MKVKKEKNDSTCINRVKTTDTALKAWAMGSWAIVLANVLFKLAHHVAGLQIVTDGESSIGAICITTSQIFGTLPKTLGVVTSLHAEGWRCVVLLLIVYPGLENSFGRIHTHGNVFAVQWILTMGKDTSFRVFFCSTCNCWVPSKSIGGMLASAWIVAVENLLFPWTRWLWSTGWSRSFARRITSWGSRTRRTRRRLFGRIIWDGQGGWLLVGDVLGEFGLVFLEDVVPLRPWRGGLVLSLTGHPNVRVTGRWGRGRIPRSVFIGGCKFIRRWGIGRRCEGVGVSVSGCGMGNSCSHCRKQHKDRSHQYERWGRQHGVCLSKKDKESNKFQIG